MTRTMPGPGAGFLHSAGVRPGYLKQPKGFNMLVLSRKAGEAIWIGENIKLTVIDFSRGHGTVRIGIDAPESIPVFREEIKQAIEREKAAESEGER